MKKFSPADLFKYPLTILLFVFMAFSLINFVTTPAKKYSEAENRALASAPAVSWAAIYNNKFSADFEKYVNDQFFYRDSWIDIKSRCEYLFMKVENNGVVYGADKTQYLKYFELDEKQFEKNKNAVLKFVERHPGKVSVLIAPSAYEIQPQKLPSEAPFVAQTPLIEQFYTQLGSGVNTIDVIDALRAHAGEYIYYRNDHHWTTDGAYYAYLEYCAANGLTPFDPSAHKRNVAGGFFGSLSAKSKLFNADGDDVYFYDTAARMLKDDAYIELYDFAKLTARDKYAMFLHSNDAVRVIENKDAPAKKLLIINDSYANCFAPFLADNYNYIKLIDLRMYSGDLDELISAEGYDDVLILYSFQMLASDVNIVKLNFTF